MAPPNPIRRRTDATAARRKSGGGGYLEMSSFRGAGIFFHWSVLLAVAYYALRGSLWGAVAYLVVILVHELGHAMVATWRDASVLYIEVHALGGACRYASTGSELDGVLIAWGGVVAQTLLAVLAFVFGNSPWSRGVPDELLVPLIGWNLMIAAFNLLPVRGFDGAEAWRIVPLSVQALGRSLRSSFKSPKPRDTARGPYVRTTARTDDGIIEDDEAERLRERLERSRDAADASRCDS